MSLDNAILRAFEGNFREERRTGKEEGRSRKVGDRELRSGEEKRCSLDSFAVYAFAAPGC